MTTSKFKLKKLMTDFIIINIIINGLFYIVNFRKHTGAVTFETISTDLMIGLIILAIACPAAGFINIPKSINKSCVDVSHRQKSIFNRLFPHHNGLRSAILTIFNVVFSYLFFIVLPQSLGVNTINHYIGFSVKVVTAIIMSGIVGYIVIELTMDDYQDKQTILMKESN